MVVSSEFLSTCLKGAGLSPFEVSSLESTIADFSVSGPDGVTSVFSWLTNSATFRVLIPFAERRGMCVVGVLAIGDAKSRFETAETQVFVVPDLETYAVLARLSLMTRSHAVDRLRQVSRQYHVVVMFAEIPIVVLSGYNRHLFE